MGSAGAPDGVASQALQGLLAVAELAYEVEAILLGTAHPSVPLLADDRIRSPRDPAGSPDAEVAGWSSARTSPSTIPSSRARSSSREVAPRHLQELGGGLVEVSAAVREVAARSAEQPPLHELGDGLGGVDAPDLVDAPPGCLAGEDHDGEDLDVAVGEPGHRLCLDSAIGEERQGPVGQQRQGLGVLDHPHPQRGQAIGELGDGGPDPGDRGLEEEARFAEGEGAADGEERPQSGDQAVLGGGAGKRDEMLTGVEAERLVEPGQGRVAGLSSGRSRSGRAGPPRP